MDDIDKILAALKELLKKIWGLANALFAFAFGIGTFALAVDMLDGADSGEWIGLVILLFLTLVTGRAARRNLSTKAAKTARGAVNGRKAQPERSREEKLRQIMQLAQQRGGELSALKTALDLDLEIEEGQQLLEYLVDKGVALMDVTEQGTMIYNFPDFNALPRSEQSEMARLRRPADSAQDRQNRRDLLP